ncbi:glycoside hydrolase family 78 protein [Solirubrobacter phytolaccae]|uniref:alpha-L-rhamnosidase n=1 Tax=Solirubrobacter phytolaccae TaxID=1404360 RepID=A0A9X3NB90_9ACTN|nr:family 78 glycoside hydrolase catalytic domain [Solirubrobacter phytolaccae]MDA0183203.1 glycoside hydrolase family 78 protein [Solirubrobacter phytolaccae]
MHRWTRAALAASLVIALSPAAAHAATLSVSGLRMDDRADQPLGVDDTTPTFSWTLNGTGAAARQTAYQVRVTDASGASLWDSGKVAGTAGRAAYQGAPLASRTKVEWQVRAWDGNGDATDWSATSSFEMGLVQPSDWGTAKWIHLPPPPLNRGVTYDVGNAEGRYVRLDVTKLGLGVYESSYSAVVNRIQLVEMQVLAPDGTNLALNKSVSAFDQFSSQGWGTKLLTDGKIISPGYMSRHLFSQDASAQSKWVQIDLGSVQKFSKIVLFPRSDSRTPDGQIPNYPVDFTLRTGTTSTPSTVMKTVTSEPNPQGPDLSNPLPIFAKPFTAAKPVAKARLYLAGLGYADATINGQRVTDTVLPGVSNPLKSVEYGAYDVTSLLKNGDNTLGVALGNGQTNVNPQANADAGRTDVYTKFNSIPVPQGTLLSPVAAGATTLTLDSVTGYAVGDSVNVDTLDGGSRLESRKVTAIGTNTLTIDAPLTHDHPAGIEVLGSGARTAMAVTPRLIGRLELTYADGTTDTIVTDPSFKTKHGPTITENYYAGVDYDARKAQPGWDEPNPDLSGWEAASITSPPSLDTKLVWREAPPVRIQRTFKATQIKKVATGSYSFNLGQNFAGIPKLTLKNVPAGTVIKIVPGESWAGNGAVSTASSGSPTGIFNTYTTSGAPTETFAPTSMYHGFQYVQISGLPADYVPDETTLVGEATNADVPDGGSVTTDSDLINTVHRMAEWSIRSNMQSTFTDCPHREKLAWLADMIQSMGSISAQFDVAGYLRGMQRHMLEAQLPDGLVPGTAPEFPIFGGGYRDDVNWGGAFIITPYTLWQTYGDTRTMREYYAPMQAYLAYVRKQVGANGLLISGLKDWIAGDTTTTAEATGTYGLYVIADQMAQMAGELGKSADAADYRALATSLATAFNTAFYDPATKTYPGSQAMAALPLAMGIVPAGAEATVLQSLVDRIYAYHPGGSGPHMSGGTVSLQATYRVLMDHDRGDVLWDVLQEPSAPSYANFFNQGRTTIPESWDFAGSQNHMILLQIDEWFSKGLTGIRQAPGSVGYERVIVKPQAVGNLGHVSGSYNTPRGTITSEWTKGAYGVTSMKVTVPAGTAATVYVPAAATQSFVATTGKATPKGRVDGYQVFEIEPGAVEFRQGTSSEGTVGGSVPATLSLSLGAPATFGTFTPGLAKEYTATTKATVISTAGDAALSVSEPGHLTNGAFSLPEPLRVSLSKSAWTAPVSNDTVDVDFKQTIKADDALRTGSYAKTLTFTLSTTTP